MTDDPKAEWTAKCVFNVKPKFAKTHLQTSVFMLINNTQIFNLKWVRYSG